MIIPCFVEDLLSSVIHQSRGASTSEENGNLEYTYWWNILFCGWLIITSAVSPQSRAASTYEENEYLEYVDHQSTWIWLAYPNGNFWQFLMRDVKRSQRLIEKLKLPFYPFFTQDSWQSFSKYVFFFFFPNCNSNHRFSQDEKVLQRNDSVHANLYYIKALGVLTSSQVDHPMHANISGTA
jgi:hypothetical protein